MLPVEFICDNLTFDKSMARCRQTKSYVTYNVTKLPSIKKPQWSHIKPKLQTNTFSAKKLRFPINDACQERPCPSWTHTMWRPGAVAIQNISPKLLLYTNLAKSRLSITYFSVALSFWNFARSTTVTLPCSVRNFKTIGQMKWILWTNEISRNLSLRWVSEGGYPIL